MPDVPFSQIDHVQLAIPAGGEDQARAFYRDLLGMVELIKPEQLAKRGGCWFASGTVQIHLGIEEAFQPARKAHPAFRCHDYEALINSLQQNGVNVVPDATIPGTTRCYIHDPFGNRIELIAE